MKISSKGEITFHFSYFIFSFFCCTFARENKINYTIMATATRRRHTSQPVAKCWNIVKDLDDIQKLELITLLAESMKPAAAKALQPKEKEEDEERQLKPYTMEEVNAMLDVAEANFAAGRGIPHEEVMQEWDEEIARMEQEAYEPAETA